MLYRVFVVLGFFAQVLDDAAGMFKMFKDLWVTFFGLPRAPLRSL